MEAVAEMRGLFVEAGAVDAGQPAAALRRVDLAAHLDDYSLQVALGDPQVRDVRLRSGFIPCTRFD
jgi:hypothetical protein